MRAPLPGGRLVPVAAAVVLCAGLVGGCSRVSGADAAGSPTATARDASSPRSVTSRLGAVPIPSPPPDSPTPVASEAHPQLYGPVERTPYRGGPTLPTSTVGTITITVTPTRGTVTLRAQDFLSRGETGHVVSLRPAGPGTVTATAAHPGRIRIRGTFVSGAAQVTWRYEGKVLVIWDFNVELD